MDPNAEREKKKEEESKKKEDLTQLFKPVVTQQVPKGLFYFILTIFTSI